MCVGYNVLNPHLSLVASWDGEVYVVVVRRRLDEMARLRSDERALV